MLNSARKKYNLEPDYNGTEQCDCFIKLARWPFNNSNLKFIVEPVIMVTLTTKQCMCTEVTFYLKYQWNLVMNKVTAPDSDLWFSQRN